MPIHCISTDYKSALSGNQINAYDDKPAEYLTKNGDQFNSNDGHNYQFNNNHWVKLSGNMIDLNSLHMGGTGTGFTTGNKLDLIDQAIYNDNMKTIALNTLDLKGLATGIALTSIENKKFTKPTPAGLIIGFIFNFYSGVFYQFSSNSEHDDEVDQARKQKNND